MATRSDLRARLQRRLGVGVVSSTEQARLDEALNSGLARAASDGVPGLLRKPLVGGVLGQLALTTVDTTQHSATVTVDNGVNLLTANVFPRDILVVDVSGAVTKFLIEDVLTAQTLDLGIPASATLSGGSSSYIQRRAIELPSSGQVSWIAPVTGGRGDVLARDSVRFLRRPFETGADAKLWDQGFSDTKGKSYVSLWPAPTSATAQWAIQQSAFKPRMDDDADTLDFPEEALDAVLERARAAYLVWSGSANQNDLAGTARALRDVDDSARNSSAGQQVHYRT